MQELGDDQVRDLVVDRRAEEDDALGEQARVDVERALAARGLLDDHRDQRAHRLTPCCLGSRVSGSPPAAPSPASRSLSRASCELGRDRLHLGGDAVERLLQRGCRRARGRRRPASMNSSMSSSSSPGSRSSLADLVVGDLDAELVGDRLEHELARDRHASPRRAAAARAPRATGRSAAGRRRRRCRAPRGCGRARSAARACAPRRASPAGVEVRRLARARRRRRRGTAPSTSSSSCSRMPRLDVGAQLVERVELGRGLARARRRAAAARALVQLLERRRSRCASAAVGELVARSRGSRRPSRPRMPFSISSTSRSRAELDDVVALGGAVVRDEVDDGDVAVLRRPALDRRRARRRCAAASRARASTASSGTSTSCFGTSSVVQSAGSGFGCTANSAVKLQSSLVARRQLVLVLGLRRPGRTRARAAAFQNQPPMWLTRPPRRRRAPCRSAARAAASAPCPCGSRGCGRVCGEVVRRVLDGVVHVVRGDLDRQPDPVVVELLDLCRHRTGH